VLKEMVADPKEREEIEREEEALRTIDALFGKTNREQKRIIDEQTRALEERDRVLGEKDRALEEKDRQIVDLQRLLHTKQ
jgi:hypothetical protein